MKRVYITLLLLFFLSAVTAQQTFKTLNFGGVERHYIQYVPDMYDGTEGVPVVFCFHGLGGTAANFFGIGMDEVADTANFIAIFPQALMDPTTGATAWNSGAGAYGFFPNPNVDDVGFVLAMLDTLSNQFNIDQSRIYATGFSMGGFFTNRLACEHPEVFDAVASLAGTIGTGLICEPDSPLRIAHFHGTNDGTVGYFENMFGLNVAAWRDIWIDSNACTNEAENGTIPNASLDGYTIAYERYGSCEDNSEVVLYTVDGADHIWLYEPVNAMSYTAEIWRFFLGIQPTLLTTNVLDDTFQEISVYPNPASGIFSVKLPLNISGAITNTTITDISGKLIEVNLEWTENNTVLNVSNLKPGLYVLRIQAGKAVYTSRIVIQ